MFTLYYHRGACSTSNHFALEEAGIEYQAIEVDLKKLDDPLVQQLRALNSMAQTPVLVLDDGHVLTQNAATLPFIADLAPDNTPLRTQRRYRRNTLFHLPFSSGRCRHCAPVRAIHTMPSK